MTMGIGGITGTLLLSVGLWAFTIGVGGPGNAVAAQSHWMLAVGPFIVVELWFPFMGNGCMMTFTRLMLTYVPDKVGICTALVISSGPPFGQCILTGWLALSFSGQ